MNLKANVIANFSGQAWRALMSFALVPFYIRYLGVEAYGLIAAFATLQVSLTVLDLGLRPALGREMARFTGGAHSARSIWVLLRSAETIVFVVAICLAILAWAVSGWLATHWVRAQHLSPSTIAHAFSLVGVVAGLQMIETLYTSAIVGLQRQVLQNVATALIATLRGLGAIGILIFVSRNIEAFFVWQTAVSLLSVIVFGRVVYQVLPRLPEPARFSLEALMEIRGYAVGMLGISLLALALTQVDKLLLSGQLPLASFGHYMLAGSIAGALSTLGAPIGAAYYPRLTELAVSPTGTQIVRVFHQCAQLLTLCVGAASIMLMVFADRILLLWTRDPALTADVAPLLRLLAAGNMLNSLMALPYLVQLAYGWTSLSLRINFAAVVLLVPAMLWAAPAYGAFGAACVWVTLNLIYFLFGSRLMFQRLLTGENVRWLLEDILVPICAGVGVALLSRSAITFGAGLISTVVLIFVTGALVTLAMALSCPILRGSFPLAIFSPRPVGMTDRA